MAEGGDEIYVSEKSYDGKKWEEWCNVSGSKGNTDLHNAVNKVKRCTCCEIIKHGSGSGSALKFIIEMVAGGGGRKTTEL
jgi:hypothetical protein